MFFFINHLNKFFFFFFKHFHFFLDYFWTIFFSGIFTTFFLKWNPRSFLEYFRAQSFGGDYVFYWGKFRGLNPSVLHINNKNLQPKKILNYFTLVFINFSSYESLFYSKFVKLRYTEILNTLAKTFSFGFFYIRGFAFILFIDACLTDDEPLWEPIEWSLIQTWILFIFGFAWIAENLIVSRYGSYTGRDKRVWMAWYKSFWLIEGYYVVNYGVVCLFVSVPWYFETNYNLSFIYSWWHWYSRVFFYKFTVVYTIVLLLAYILQLNLRWLSWKKSLIIILLINIFISYLIYTHFLMLFFGYFTDPIWYQKARSVDYIQLSHEPAKWGWGPAKKDHYTYHNVRTVFWFKNDGPFAASFLNFHLFLFGCIFFLFFFWLSLLRRVWATKEIPTTLTTYCVSGLRQFFYFFLFLYFFILASFITNYMRLPWEFYYFLDNTSWVNNFIQVGYSYPHFLIKILSTA